MTKLSIIYCENDGIDAPNLLKVKRNLARREALQTNIRFKVGKERSAWFVCEPNLKEAVCLSPQWTATRSTDLPTLVHHHFEST